MRLSTLLLYCPPSLFGQANGVFILRNEAVPSTSTLQSIPTLTSPPEEPASIITPPPSAVRSIAAQWTGLQEPCEPACVAQFPVGISYGWQRAVATQTVTVAMLAHLLWSNGTTDLKLLPAKILSTLKRLPRNEYGTMIQPLTIDQGAWGTMTTTLAYPTAYTDYPMSYWWSGVLPTKTANRMVCSTATAQQEMIFSSHPSYDTIDHSSHLFYPKEYLNGSIMDGAGFVFGRLPVQLLNFYEHAFPAEAGFAYCSERRNIVAAPQPATTSEYITITRTVLVEPAVYRQSTVTQSLEAPTPIGPDRGSAKSAISSIIPMPIAAHGALITRAPPNPTSLLSTVERSIDSTTTVTQTIATETTVAQLQLGSTSIIISLPSTSSLAAAVTLSTTSKSQPSGVLGPFGASTVHSEETVTYKLVPPSKPPGQPGLQVAYTEFSITYGPNAPAAAQGVFGAETVRSEDSVSAGLPAPTPRPPTVQSNPTTANAPPGLAFITSPPTLPRTLDTPSSVPNTTPIPALLDTIPLPPIPVAPSSVIIGGSSISISIIVSPPTPQSPSRPQPAQGPNAAAPPSPVQPYTPTIVIAGQTATPGQTITINNKPVSITESGGAIYATTPDQAPILLLAPAGSAPAVAGSSSNNAGAPAVDIPHDDMTPFNLAPGLAVRPIAISLPPGPGSSAGPLATLTPIFASPGAGGVPAYIISGQTIAAGRGAITLGTGTSATVLSLATDSAGEAVLNVNGVKTTLPAAVAVVSGENGSVNSFAMFPASTSSTDASEVISKSSSGVNTVHNSKTTASPSASAGGNTSSRSLSWLQGMIVSFGLILCWV